MKYLLDSGAIVAAIKGRLPVVLKLSALKPGDVAVSVISRMQVEMSLRQQPRALATYGRLLRELFGTVRVLDFGQQELQHAVSLSGYLQPDGERLSGFELQVAATALAHQLTLVTDNAAPYLHVPGLELENWLS